MEGNRLLPNLSIKKIWKKLTSLQTDVNELNSNMSKSFNLPGWTFAHFVGGYGFVVQIPYPYTNEYTVNITESQLYTGSGWVNITFKSVSKKSVANMITIIFETPSSITTNGVYMVNVKGTVTAVD